MPVVLVLAWVCTGALAAVVLVRALGVERGSVLVLLIGALPLTLLPAYAVLAVAAVLRRRLLAAAAAALAVAHLLVVAPAVGVEPVPAAAGTAPHLRVVTANLFARNADAVAAGQVLRALEPDVLVVPELSPAGLEGLRAAGLLAELPHAVVELGSRTETVGLFSRLPLQDASTRSGSGRRLPRATVLVGDVPVRLLTAHPLPPLSVLQPLWRSSLADLADEAEQVEQPLVVAGDLNADRDHAPFRRLLATGLRDAHDSTGRGLARTWPSELPVLHLDHVLVRDGAGASLHVLGVREVAVPGSDHLAVVADLAVLPR